MKRTIIALAVGATVLGGTVAYAATADDASGVVIHGCVNRLTGYVRIVTSATSKSPRCLATETSLDWNQTGPQGPAGSQGPAGVPGPDDAGLSRIHLAFWDVPAGGTTTGFVYCPAERPVATGGGVSLGDVTDPTSADALVVSSYPMARYGGLEDQADGWKATVRNQTGRPFNGRTITFTVYAICSPGAVQIGL